MADNLTDTAETRVLDWLTGNPTTAPVLPLMVRLMTVNGSDSAPGTEAAGSGYAPKSMAFPAAASGGTSNTALIRWDTLDAVNQIVVVGIEIWDSAAAPVRWWSGPLTASKTVNGGDPCEIAAGDVDLTLG